MEGVCYAFNEDQYAKKIAGNPGESEKKDFWEYSKKKLLNDKLIKRVTDFREAEIQAIPPKKVEKLKNFI